MLGTGKGDPSPSRSALFTEVAQQGGLAHVVDGQHPDEVAVFEDGQGSETTLLQDTVAFREEVGVGRDGRKLRLHQVTDGTVAAGGVGRGHDLVAGDDADQVSVLVEDGEVLLVAVDDGVEDLAEVVVGRYGLGAALGTHHIGDREPAHLFPLADHPRLATRAQEEEEADGEALPYGRGDIRGAHGPQTRGEQAAQHTAAIHREGRDHVEDDEGYVDRAQRDEDLAQGAYTREYVRRDREAAPEEQGKPEEYGGEHDVDERPGHGDFYFVDRSLRQGLHPGEPADGQERDVLNFAPQA